MSRGPWKQKRQWPIAPLMAATGLNRSELGRLAWPNCHSQPRPPAFVGDKLADRLATTLGLHPTAIWPDWCDILDDNAAA